jgi:menaquinone-specific isochorismate synthase
MVEIDLISPADINEFQADLPPATPAHSLGRLISYTLPWPATSLLTFLQQAPHAPRIYWEQDPNDLTFAGYGLAATLTASGPDRFQVIQQQAARLFAHAIQATDDTPPHVGPRLFGGFAFRSGAAAHGIWSAFPAAHFILPRYQLTRLGDQAWLTINHCLDMGEQADQIAASLRADVQMLRLALDLVDEQEVGALADVSRPALSLKVDYPMDAATWEQLITLTTNRIRAGELDKVVLARVCRARASRLIEPVEVLTWLEQNYAECYRFLIEPIPGHAFFGATPELLADVKGTSLRTAALAGSLKRGQTPVEDARLGQALLADPKDRQEHAFVVDAIQKNLHPLVSDLQAPSQPNLYRLSNIQHLQTPIQGQLSQPVGVLPVVDALHPTPAMGGTPRELALHLIAEEEPFSRGWYASPVGWIDAAGNGLFAVAIRSAVSVGHQACLFAGVGIVADSDPAKEWQETNLKFRPMLEALGGTVEA